MIIGLSGYAQSGKDTVAQILVDNYGYTRVAFADKIRELLYEMDPPLPIGYGLEAHVVGLQNYVEIYGWETGKQNLTVRSMLQNIGLGARKVFGEDFWVKQALSSCKPWEKIVVTDVRFKNEADYLKGFPNAQLWRIKRNGVQAVNAHVSETEMDGYPVDQIFTNNETIEDLTALVKVRMGLLNDFQG